MDFTKLNALASEVWLLSEKIKADSRNECANQKDIKLYREKVQKFANMTKLRETIHEDQYEAFQMLIAYHSSKLNMNEYAKVLISTLYSGEMWEMIRLGNFPDTRVYEKIEDVKKKDVFFTDCLGQIYAKNGSPLYMKVSDNVMIQLTKKHLDQR